MAERRMFAKTIIDSDAFLEMPMSTQVLYFHLSMRADDEGFLNNPKRIQRMIGCSDDDLKLLLAKNFIIAFDSGVIVIKHWRIHNYIRSDRFKETVYQDERSQLTVKDNGAYTFGIPSDNQTGYQMDTQVRLGKDRLGKVSKDIYGPYGHVLLTQDEHDKMIAQNGEDLTKELIDILDEYFEEFPDRKKKYKSHYLTMNKKDSWVREKAEKGKTAKPFSVYDWVPPEERA